MEEQNLRPVNLKSQYDDDIFKIPVDIVNLPSEGKLYTNIPASIEVEYVTAKDEDILYSSELMSNGKTFSTLVKEKIKDKSINIDDLLIGDFNEILLFLRRSAYGNIYNTNVTDPDTLMVVKQPVDLTQLERKGISAVFNESGEFEYVLPMMNKRVTFKLNTVGMMDYINNRAEQQKNKLTGVVPYIKVRLEHQITSVEDSNGKVIKDKIYISRFVDVIPPTDRLHLMQYMESIEPGVLLKSKFKSSIKENDYEEKFILAYDFFYPQTI